MQHLLQIANVGRIIGGTAACAWTVIRSLPTDRHTVTFLGRITPETRQAFVDCELKQWNRITRNRVAAIKPDVILLHNTSPARCDSRLPSPTILYRHSTTRPTSADLTLYCSRWLANNCHGNVDQVCYQAVPRALQPESFHDTRPYREQLVVGRICTPIKHKWPDDVAPFYRSLAAQFPHVSWEFIGCPAHLQPKLKSACNGRAEFIPAAWHARGRLWQWDAMLYHNSGVTESFGRTVAEAMRAGCIPIVDDRGGFREQITQESGYLCSGSADFTAALTQLHSPTRRWKMSQAARAAADDRFSLARFAQDLQTHFRDASARFHERG